jgi:hypothetical protein
MATIVSMAVSLRISIKLLISKKLGVLKLIINIIKIIKIKKLNSLFLGKTNIFKISLT